MSMDKVGKYVATIKYKYREAVLDQIMRNRLIREALGSPQGNILFDNIIDEIAKKTRGIVNSCIIESKKDQMDRIQRLASEIHVAFNLMKDWAQIIKDGEQHEEAMNK
jgi:hypothetical protein